MLGGGANHKSVVVRTNVARILDNMVGALGAEKFMGSSRELQVRRNKPNRIANANQPLKQEIVFLGNDTATLRASPFGPGSGMVFKRKPKLCSQIDLSHFSFSFRMSASTPNMQFPPCQDIPSSSRR